MCYGDSIFRTCPHCNTTEQIFEQQGVCPFGSSPPETWWILPCVILEDVSLNEPCDSCTHLFKRFDSLSSPTSQTSLPDFPNAGNSALLKNPDDEDALDLSDSAFLSSKESHTDDPEEHLNLICAWYDDIEHYLNSIKRSIPSIRTRCIAGLFLRAYDGNSSCLSVSRISMRQPCLAKKDGFLTPTKQMGYIITFSSIFFITNRSWRLPCDRADQHLPEVLQRRYLTMCSQM